jgi:hypothetical protein
VVLIVTLRLGIMEYGGEKPRIALGLKEVHDYVGVSFRFGLLYRTRGSGGKLVITYCDS